MRFDVRTAGTALAAGTMMLAVAAAPAAAANKPSVARAVRDVHAANRALAQVREFASSDSAAARRALRRAQVDVAAAAHQALWLHADGSATATAGAFEYVARQYDAEVQTYTKLVVRGSASLQTELAQALVPALAGRMQALAFLGEVTSQLSGNALGTATSVLTQVIGNGPGEILSLTGDVKLSAGVSADVTAVLGQALAAAGGTLDASISELETLIPTLQADVQAKVQSELSALTGELVDVQASLGATTTSVAGMLGGVVSGELGQVTGILQGILGDLPSVGVGVTGSGTITGIGTVTGSGTVTGGSGDTGTVTSTGGVDLAPFLASLFGQLGVTLPGI